VHAEGDAPEGSHQDLADRLGKLLAQPRFGTDASQFSSWQVNGPIHEKITPAAAADEDEK
jgi:hypothetical protein